MKVLTLHQPYASLCVVINPATGLPYKTIETRGWKPPQSLIGQRIVLQAAKKWPPVGLQVGEWRVGVEPSYRGNPTMFRPDQDGYVYLPLGTIVATCTLVDVVPIVGGGEEGAVRRLEVYDNGSLWLSEPENEEAPGEEWTQEVTDQRPYGDFTVGRGLFVPCRYAWLLADVQPVDPPVPFKGGQGLTKTWEPPTAELGVEPPLPRAPDRPRLPSPMVVEGGGASAPRQPDCKGVQ